MRLDLAEAPIFELKHLNSKQNASARSKCYAFALRVSTPLRYAQDDAEGKFFWSTAEENYLRKQKSASQWETHKKSESLKNVATQIAAQSRKREATFFIKVASNFKRKNMQFV